MVDIGSITRMVSGADLARTLGTKYDRVMSVWNDMKQVESVSYSSGECEDGVLAMSKKRKIAMKKRRKRKGDRETVSRIR